MSIASCVVVANDRPAEFCCYRGRFSTVPAGNDSASTTFSILFADPTGRTCAMLEVMGGTLVSGHGWPSSVLLARLLRPGRHAFDGPGAELSGIAISYIDPAGHQWQSNLSARHSKDVFEVKTSAIERGKGGQAISATVYLDCRVFDREGHSIRLTAAALPLVATMGN